MEVTGHDGWWRLMEPESLFASVFSGSYIISWTGVLDYVVGQLVHVR